MKKISLVALILCAVSFAQTNVAHMLSGVNAQTGTSYTFIASDVTKVVTFTNANPVSVTLISGSNPGFGAGSIFTAVNLGAGAVTITCTACTINGGASVQILQNQSVNLYGDGTNYISAMGTASGQNGTINGAAPNAGLQVIGTTLGLISCPSGQSPQSTGTGYACAVSGGGGGNITAGSTQGQVATWDTGSSAYLPVSKNAIDVRDAGVTCDGTTDDGPALNTLFGNISGRQVNFPDTCKISTSVQLVIQGQSGFVLHGMGDRGVLAGVAGPIIYGCSASGSGPVLYINRSGYGTVEGLSIVPKGPSGCSTSTFTGSIQVDSTGNPGVTTHDLVFDHLGLTTSAAGGAISGYTGISITDGGKQNGEMIRVSNSWIHCQNSSGSIGIANLDGTSDNDLAEHNSISSCKYGIQNNGNMRIVGNLLTSNGASSIFGTFGASIYTPGCSAGQMNILYNESDGGGPFIDNDHTAVTGCNSGFNVIGNMIGVSDIASGEYVIDVGGGGNAWNVQGNTFLVTQNTSQYIIGSQAQPAGKGPLGHLYETGNYLRSPTLSDTLGWEDITRPFQAGESRSQDTANSTATVPIGNTWGTDIASTNHLWFPPLVGNTFLNQSPYVGLRSWTGSTADDWLFQTIANSTQSALTFNHNNGPATTNWFNWDGQVNGLKIAALSTPALPVGVTPTGIAGATTYTYALVAYGQSGNTAGSATKSTTTGNASLSSTNYNLIQFVPTASIGANKWCIWRTAGGATQGNIGCVNAVATSANGQNADTYFLKDTGLTGDGTTLPVSNTTGQLVASSGTLTIPSDVVANNVTTGNLVINGSCTGCGGGGGSGTVTSVATTTPITGGPFSTTGTIACPTCLVASSPAVGILHVAGSTQTATSSAVVDADLSGAVAVAHGGTGSTTAAGALIGLLPAGTRVGDMLYCKTYASSACTLWDLVPGNGTGATGWLQETLAGAPSWTIPPGSGTVAVVGAGSLTSTALMTGGGTQLTQTPSSTTTLDSSGNISVAAGGSIGSADTGTPKFTFAANLITANKQVTGTIFNAGTGFAIPAATTAGHYLRNNATNFVDSAILAGDLPSLSGTYLALSGGGTMNGNILFTDNLYDLGTVSATRPRSGYFATSLNAPTINAGTGFQIGGAAPNGHFLSGTGTNYADNGRLLDDGTTLSYSGSGGIQASSISITTPLQLYSSLPASPFSALASNSGFGVSSDGNFYVSNNGGTPSQLVTAANGFSLLGSGTNTSGALVVGTGASLAPTSGTVGRITANAMVFASTTLTNSTLPTDGQCLGRSGTTIIGFTCSGGSAGTFQTNAVNLTSSSTINFQNSAATNGLTLTFANPSAGNVQLGLSGTLTNAGLANSANTVNGQTCTLGSTCNVESATSGQVAISGGSGAALTGAADLTYSTHTFSTTANGIFDFSASTATNGFILPSNLSNTASSAGAMTYDTSAGNYHGFTGASDQVFLVISTASLPANNILLSSQLNSGKMQVQGTGISSLNLVTAGSAAGAANQVAYSAGASKGLSFATLDNTTTHVLHATAGAPTFSALVAADLPAALGSSTTTHNIEAPLVCADTSASGTAQVCSTTPSFTPAAQDCIIYTTTTANTGTGLTINVNSLGAKSVAKYQTTTTLAANDVRANTNQTMCYDGTNWELSGQLGNAPTGSGTVNSGTSTHLAYYASSTTAVSDLGADITWTSGTHTLAGGASLLFDLSALTASNISFPSGVALTSPALTTPAIGAATGTSVTLGTNGGTGGSVVLKGSTSGSATINTSATGVLALPSGTTATNMVLTTPNIGTPSAGTLTNATGLPGAGIVSASVTATQLAAQYSKGSCTEVWGGSGTSFAMTSGDDAISNNSCYNDSGVTRTITAVKCRSDNAANTTVLTPTFGSAGTGTAILTGTVTCGNSYAYSTSGTLNNTAWTTGTGIDPGMSTVGNATSIALIIEYTF